MTGYTDTPGSSFPGTAGSLIQSTNGGGVDAFVAKITTNTSPSCTAAQANPTALWSPNHQFVPIVVIGVTDPDGDSLTITVTGVTQDEPVTSTGSGNTSPDGVIQAGSASVRAKRAHNGNGGTSTGAVTVGVPHSQKKGLTAIDDGQLYDSTIP